MADGIGITISGLDDCLRFLEKAPDKMVSVSRTAMRKGAQAGARYVRRRIPPRWKGLVKSKVTINDRGNINGVFGLFNGHQTQGAQNGKQPVFDWFKAYWRNYGTLEGRDPSHVFSRPVKHMKTSAAQSRRNRMGEPHENFFEHAIAGYEDVVVQAFKESLDQNIDKLY